MNLKILLPFEVFADKSDVSRIVAEGREGSFGLLPHRLDCVAALAPGIFTYETQADGTVYVAVDEGVLVKAGGDVYRPQERIHSQENARILLRIAEGHVLPPLPDVTVLE